jgi:N-acetylglucosaminyl-diphospho-decaprenol L-rhamnosyltransferase
VTPEYTISVISHGHEPMVRRLLGDLDREPSLQGVRVLLTLNLHSEEIDLAPFRNLRIEILRNDKPLGFGANHNRAFALCRTPWFVVLNPDLRLAANEPFTSLLACARQHPQVGVVAPRVMSSAGVAEDSVRQNLTPWSLARRHLFGRRKPAVVDSPAGIGTPFRWLAGMCLVFNSAAFRAVGGFDERFFLYCEDYDLCARLYNNGYRLLLDQGSQVIHDAQRGSHRSMRYLYWHLSGLLRVWTSRPFWQIVFQTREAGASR